MTNYHIESKKSVRKDFKRIQLKDRKEIINLIETLSDDPRPMGSKKLKSKGSLYRIRYRDYRVLYEIHDDIVTVIVIRVGHRKNVYR